MFTHKSLGLLTGMLVAPRIAHRLLCRSEYNVAELAGNSSLENMVGKAAHYAMYGFMAVMPGTGIAMGYFGGKGLPFFIPHYQALRRPLRKPRKRMARLRSKRSAFTSRWGRMGSIWCLRMSGLPSATSCGAKPSLLGSTPLVRT